MVEYTRRNLMATSVAAAVGAGVTGTVTAQDDEDESVPGAPSIRGDMKRLSTTAFGAEVTGPFVFETGELLYSLQHPSDDNPEPYDVAGVGVVDDFRFTFNGANDEFEELQPPRTEEEQGRVQTAAGEYRLLVQVGDEINGGTERFGHPQTPDGRDVGEVAGGSPGVGGNSDMNFFVSTTDDASEGYLFTNNETRPGAISRTPLSRDAEGYWQADLENAMELENLESFRAIGGTRINCYGDLTPWETPLSAEEEWGHPRLTGLATTRDILEQGDGIGLRGGCEFWNRPDGAGITDAIEDIFGDDAWTPEGAGNLASLDRQAYYLGGEPIDLEDEDAPNVFDEPFPNRYRYAYIVEVTEPASDDPVPVKHYAMGRSSWEAPEVLSDERTVYLNADGGARCIYKFVAEEPIPSYDDPMDVRGTLYAANVTNDEAAKRKPPAEVDLEIEWLEMGTASNAEVESWIAEYDDVTQIDYLETHADTDWRTDFEQALREADEEVARYGNQDYITDEEIVEWATQREEDGPDGVDEELRRVPFLETRAAAKEIGASVEFNKAEGVDSHDEAQPGDFVYFGISSLGGSMSDDEGEIQFEQVDTGVVYRGELEEDYNVSRLEPIVVGPNASDPASVLDDGLVNVDNVMVLDDHRVLFCEDKGHFGRSYPNDALWVYEPPIRVAVGSASVGYGRTESVDVTLAAVPGGVAGGRVGVSVADGDVAQIVDASYHDGIELTADPTIDDDGSAVEFRFADLEESVEPGDQTVTLATVELEGVGTGRTDLTVDVHALDDDDGERIDIDLRHGEVVTGPPPLGGGSGGAAPNDLDGDGRFEDVNGNGRLDYDDVVVFFENVETDAADGDAFDFNENGRVDYDDVTTLYEDL